MNTDTKAASPFLIALAAMVALSVIMGIGRFAFTPMLPLMLRDHLVDLQQGGWLATVNYIGYFVGAMVCTVIRRYSRHAIRHSLAAVVVLTALMGWMDGQAIWLALRFLVGVVTGFGFVSTSGWCMGWLATSNRLNLGGVMYAGPGVGILVSGLVGSAMLNHGWHAQSAWLWCAVLALISSLLVWRVVGRQVLSKTLATYSGTSKAPKAPKAARATAAHAPAHVPASAAAGVKAPAIHSPNPTPPIPGPDNSGSALPSSMKAATASRQAPISAKPNPGQPSLAGKPGRMLIAGHILAYGLQGFGYIITATFLPVMASRALADAGGQSLLWPLFGLCVAIGALLATRLPAAWNHCIVLATLYVLQGLGVLCTIFWLDITGFALGTILLGLPFTVITLLGMREARRLGGSKGVQMMGASTASYALGQIAGPPLATSLVALTGSFNASLGVATAVLFAGALLYIVLFAAERQPPQ
jgi:MFS family permease